MIGALKNSFSRFFLSPRFFLGLGVLVVLYTLAFVFPIILWGVHGLALLLIAAVCTEYIQLFSYGGIEGSRSLNPKLSNGDDNQIRIELRSNYPFDCPIEVYDELPIEWQVRNFNYQGFIREKSNHSIGYTHRPTTRGFFEFGAIQVLAQWKFGLIKRRFTLQSPSEVHVYPSYLSMLKYEYLAISNHLTMAGIKKIRRVGQHTEFEKIKEYVAGDDFRTINWKATARRDKLMANVYQDERSQQVYCLLDKGRVMNQPFADMTLLDHAINASLVLANIAIKKYDKAGIITFDEQQTQTLPASRKPGHMTQVQELLYRQDTRFLESDYERLYLQLKRFVPQRSLLILFTNFDTVSSMKRRLPYLKAMAKNHLLLVVFFENTETLELLHKKAKNLHDVYRKTVAEKMRFEKEQIVSELRKNGITSLLTSPEDLTINTINRYLELKARGLI